MLKILQSRNTDKLLRGRLEIFGIFRFFQTFFLQDFLLEKIDGCTYDYLALFDGPTNTSRKIDQLCGLQFPDDITSTGNNMLLHFSSDADVSGKGFSLTYTMHQALRNDIV